MSQFKEVYLAFDKKLSRLGQIFAIGQFLFVVNDQILNKKFNHLVTLEFVVNQETGRTVILPATVRVFSVCQHQCAIKVA